MVTTAIDETGTKNATIYSKAFLAIYDFYVLALSNRFLWRCPTKLLLNQYNQNISLNHLDVGVGAGYYLDKCQRPVAARKPNIHLLDWSADSLSVSAKRIGRYQPVTHQANIYEPLNIKLPKFDSIAINYLLHCLPGDLSKKEIVFKNLVPLLNTDGKFFGATILGKNTRPNFFAKKVMAFYNSKNIFGNLNDDFVSLENILKKYFKNYKIKQIGCVALFQGTV